MNVILLAGGRGTRFSEETRLRPKPMIEIGGMPILEHIMLLYSAHGFKDFVIACGYKSDVIKEYFSGYQAKHANWAINLKGGQKRLLQSAVPDWNVSLIETGLNTMTGGRILRLKNLVGSATFMATYGDGIGNIDIAALVRFHRKHGRLATVTATRPPARFGCMEMEGESVRAFSEKPQTSAGWINGGFFVFEPGVFDYLTSDATILEREPLEGLARDGQLMAYQHHGFWQPMDTLRDKELLEDLWNSGEAPWKVWRNADGVIRLLPWEASAGHGADGVQGPVARDVA